MAIRRCSCQSHDTLEGFYTGLINGRDIQIGKSMLDFLSMVNELFKETQMFGMTSHYHLKIFPTDDCESIWLISIISPGNNEYYIEYLLPEEKAPWKHAFVTGVASSQKEIIKYLAIALKESHGWSINNEIENALKD